MDRGRWRVIVFPVNIHFRRDISDGARFAWRIPGPGSPMEWEFICRRLSSYNVPRTQYHVEMPSSFSENVCYSIHYIYSAPPNCSPIDRLFLYGPLLENALRRTRERSARFISWNWNKCAFNSQRFRISMLQGWLLCLCVTLDFCELNMREIESSPELQQF